jgi:hypothetical protein
MEDENENEKRQKIGRRGVRGGGKHEDWGRK